MEHIRILNMDEYNPRKDRKRHSWIRVDNSLAFDPKFSHFEPDQFWFLIFLVGLASFGQKDSVTADLKYLETHSRLSKKKIIETLQMLEKMGTITRTTGNQLVTAPESYDTGSSPIGITTYVRTNERNTAPADSPPPVFDFESIYKKYPRKRGKDEGMIRLKARITTPEALSLFATAVQNYAKECELAQTPEDRIKHWSSFVGTDDKEPWRDYLDPPDPKKFRKATTHNPQRGFVAE